MLPRTRPSALYGVAAGLLTLQVWGRLGADASRYEITVHGVLSPAKLSLTENVIVPDPPQLPPNSSARPPPLLPPPPPPKNISLPKILIVKNNSRPLAKQYPKTALSRCRLTIPSPTTSRFFVGDTVRTRDPRGTGDWRLAEVRRYSGADYVLRWLDSPSEGHKADFERGEVELEANNDLQEGDPVLVRVPGGNNEFFWSRGQLMAARVDGDNYIVSVRSVQMPMAYGKPKTVQEELMLRVGTVNVSAQAWEVRYFADLPENQLVLAWDADNEEWVKAKVMRKTQVSLNECSRFTVRMFLSDGSIRSATLDVWYVKPKTAFHIGEYVFLPRGEIAQVKQVSWMDGELSATQIDDNGKPKTSTQSWRPDEVTKVPKHATWKGGSKVMAQDAFSKAWYPASIFKDGTEDPLTNRPATALITDDRGVWTGLYRIKWLDANSFDRIKREDELKLRSRHSVSKHLTTEDLQQIGCWTPPKGRVFAPRVAVDAKCPKNCSTWTQDVGHFCNFWCEHTDCPPLLDKEAYVFDRERRECRRCGVQNCERCAKNDDKVCLECRSGWELNADSRCSKKVFGMHGWVLRSLWDGTLITIVAGTLLALIILWYIDLRLRATTNPEGFQAITDMISLCRIRIPPDDVRTHLGAPPQRPTVMAPVSTSAQPLRGELYPFTTNLLATQVAGPGLTLFMHFQLSVLIWGLFFGVAWWALAQLIGNKDLLEVGTETAESSREQCSLVHWGQEVLDETAHVKLAFVLAVYVLTFAASVTFAVIQRRRFEAVDGKTTSMEDFAALCLGLPPFQGELRLEEALKEAFASATAERVVGVSVCWDFRAEADEVLRLARLELRQQQAAQAGQRNAAAEAAPALLPAADGGDPELVPVSFLVPGAPEAEAAEAGGGGGGGGGRCGPCRRAAEQVDSLLLAVYGYEPPGAAEGGEAAAAEQQADDDASVRALLLRLRASGEAFVVFGSESARDAAVEKSRAAGGFTLEVEGQRFTVQLEKELCEPITARWASFGGTTLEFAFRCIKGVAKISVALMTFSVCFQFPYAKYVASYRYSRGEPLNPTMATFFSMIVVIGNQTMYLVSDMVAESLGFWFEDSKAAAYVVFYSTACMISVVMDLGITGFQTYDMMVLANMHTYEGRKVEDLDSWYDVYRSYPMQSAIGGQLAQYAFPACFFVPFAIEPVLLLIFPHLARHLVRTHKEVDAQTATELGALMSMDLARYADVLLNAMVVTLALWLPSGYFVKLFLLLTASHVFIYALDHWKVLRMVPSFHLASYRVDAMAQNMVAVPLGLMLSGAFVLANCRDLDGPDSKLLDEYQYCFGDRKLAAGIAIAFFGHVAVHTALLAFLLPRCFRSHKVTEVSYEEAAASSPCSWFSANPVNCLRSKHVYQHSPPCLLYEVGSEHLLQANPDIGLHYRGSVMGTEPAWTGGTKADNVDD